MQSPSMLYGGLTTDLLCPIIRDMPKKRIKFRIRQGLKDFAVHGAEQAGITVTEIVRRTIDTVLSQNLTPEDAHGYIEIGRVAAPSSTFAYALTPWSELVALLEPGMIECLTSEAKRLGVGRDELFRGMFYDQLLVHYALPPVQTPSEDEIGYALDSTLDAQDRIIFLDPRHPNNKGRWREAMERLQVLSSGPDAPSRYMHLEWRVRRETDWIYDEYQKRFGPKETSQND